MPRYRITLPVKSSLTVDIDADSPEGAVQRAVDLFHRPSGEHLAFSVYEVGKLRDEEVRRANAGRKRSLSQEDLDHFYRETKFLGTFEIDTP